MRAGSRASRVWWLQIKFRLPINRTMNCCWRSSSGSNRWMRSPPWRGAEVLSRVLSLLRKRTGLHESCVSGLRRGLQGYVLDYARELAGRRDGNARHRRRDRQGLPECRGTQIVLASRSPCTQCARSFSHQPRGAQGPRGEDLFKPHRQDAKPAKRVTLALFSPLTSYFLPLIVRRKVRGPSSAGSVLAWCSASSHLRGVVAAAVLFGASY